MKKAAVRHFPPSSERSLATRTLGDRLTAQSLRSTRHTMSKEEVCVDCGEAKRSAEARAAVPVVDGHGQLQLGACQPLYEAWTDCIEKKDNQASACAEVLKGFKACHARMSAGRLEAPAPQ